MEILCLEFGVYGDMGISRGILSTCGVIGIHRDTAGYLGKCWDMYGYVRVYRVSRI